MPEFITKYHYTTVTMMPSFLPDEPPFPVANHGVAEGARIVAPSRTEALAIGRERYGVDFAGVRRVDVSCDFCDDRCFVGNAGRWTDPNEPATAPCPRCCD